MFDTLRECNSVVTGLTLYKNAIDDECMQQLGEYVQENKYLERLNINGNKITDKGVEILSEYLSGNILLKELGLYYNRGITNASVPYLVDIANKSYITNIYLVDTSITYKNQQEINNALSIPIDEREIPIKSNTKSAAKISAST